MGVEETYQRKPSRPRLRCLLPPRVSDSKLFRCYKHFWGQSIQNFALTLNGILDRGRWHWSPGLVKLRGPRHLVIKKRKEKKDHIKEFNCFREKAAIIWFDTNVMVMVKVQVINVIN